MAVLCPRPSDSPFVMNNRACYGLHCPLLYAQPAAAAGCFVLACGAGDGRGVATAPGRADVLMEGSSCDRDQLGLTAATSATCSQPSTIALIQPPRLAVLCHACARLLRLSGSFNGCSTIPVCFCEHRHRAHTIRIFRPTPALGYGLIVHRQSRTALFGLRSTGTAV